MKTLIFGSLFLAWTWPLLEAATQLTAQFRTWSDADERTSDAAEKVAGTLQNVLAGNSELTALRAECPAVLAQPALLAELQAASANLMLLQEAAWVEVQRQMWALSSRGSVEIETPLRDIPGPCGIAGELRWRTPIILSFQDASSGFVVNQEARWTFHNPRVRVLP